MCNVGISNLIGANIFEYIFSLLGKLVELHAIKMKNEDLDLDI